LSGEATTWVIFAGLPGTGKSTLARSLAERLGAAILDKDRIRGALFPEALTDYSLEQDQLCMRAMLEAAAYLTGRRRVKYVFFDGRTFSARGQVEEVLLAAKQAGAVLAHSAPDVCGCGGGRALGPQRSWSSGKKSRSGALPQDQAAL
jgi:adenylylsulfate kinase-like enzyme